MSKIRELTYNYWREAMLFRCAKTFGDRLCPFCQWPYEDNAEYVDIGVGYQQVTGNYCDNPDCGASEQGMYEYDESTNDFLHGWVRPKCDPGPK